MSGRTKALGDILNDEAFWAEQRTAVMGQMVPLFIRMFQAGAAMGARRRPRTKDELDDIIEDAGGITEIVFDADRINAVATEFITQYTNTWWEALNRGTRERLRSAIQTAAANGLGVAGGSVPALGSGLARRDVIGDAGDDVVVLFDLGHIDRRTQHLELVFADQRVEQR